MSVLRGHRPFRAWTTFADFGAPCGKRRVVRIRQVPVPSSIGPIYEARLSVGERGSFDEPRGRQQHVPGRGLNPLFLQDTAWESFAQRYPSIVPAALYLPDGHMLDSDHILLYVEHDRATTFGKYVVVHAASSLDIECRQSFFAPTDELWGDLFDPEPRVVYIEPSWQYLIVALKDLAGTCKTCWPCQSPQRQMTKWKLPRVSATAKIYDYWFQGNRIYLFAQMGDEEEEDLVVVCTDILGSEQCSPYRRIITLQRSQLLFGLGSYFIVVSPRESAVFFVRTGVHNRVTVFYPSQSTSIQEEWLFPDDTLGTKALVFDSAENLFFSPHYHTFMPNLSYYLV